MLKRRREVGEMNDQSASGMEEFGLKCGSPGGKGGECWGENVEDTV